MILIVILLILKKLELVHISPLKDKLSLNAHAITIKNFQLIIKIYHLPVCFVGSIPFNLAISLAIFSLSFSHQFFVGQNTSTEQPSAIVSKHSDKMCSSSPFASIIGTKSRIFFMVLSYIMGPILMVSVRGTGR